MTLTPEAVEDLLPIAYVLFVLGVLSAVIVALHWRNETWYRFREHESNEEQPTYSIQLSQYRNEIKRRTRGRRHRAARY